ncbi:hypothetical protein WDU94_002925 [Cyamophila willieti]
MSQKNQYSVSKFRLTVKDQLRALHNEGDLINMNKLTEKFKKAYEAQYAFHNMLTNATDKGQGISLTPVQKLHFRQIKRVQDLADMLKEKGLSEQLAVKRASDRMLEYWFKACIYLTLLLVINVYTLNAHEDHDDDLGLVGETDIQEGIVEESAQMNADTDILHRIRRDISQISAEIEELMNAHKVNLTEEIIKFNRTEEQLSKKFNNLHDMELEQLRAKIKEATIAQEEAAQSVERAIIAEAKKRQEAVKGKLNATTEKEIRSKVKGKGKEEKTKKLKRRKRFQPTKEEASLITKRNQTDADKISWSTIKQMSRNHSNSHLKFRLAIEGQKLTLKNQGDLINLKKLTEKFDKAVKMQDAFHIKLLKASENETEPVALTVAETLHYMNVVKIKDYINKLKEKGLSQEMAVHKASDKMLEYWFKYVEQQQQQQQQQQTQASTNPTEHGTKAESIILQ